MKISCIQMDMEFCQPDRNFEKAKRLIAKAAEDKADVIVLPETWNTGFFPKENLEELSDRNGESVKREIGALAKQYNINIVAGSVADLRDGKVYNTAYIFNRNGDCIAEYSKTHLFTYMDEHRFFEKGSSICKFTLDGILCGVIICYDIRFPELTRTMSVDGLDCLFVVSQWPKERINHLRILTQARAIENQIFLACCNSCGKAEETVYGGNSSIINPWGEILAHAGENEEIISAECDCSVLKDIRKTINVFADRRAEIYRLK